MHPLFPHRVSITWEVTVLAVSSEGLVAPSCQRCGGTLGVHQPDEDHPSHLLGTCGKCGAWYMIEAPANAVEAYMFNMPGVDYVREKLAEVRKTSKNLRR